METTTTSGVKREKEEARKYKEENEKGKSDREKEEVRKQKEENDEGKEREREKEEARKQMG